MGSVQCPSLRNLTIRKTAISKTCDMQHSNNYHSILLSINGKIKTDFTLKVFKDKIS